MAGLIKSAVDALRSPATPMLVVGMENKGGIIPTAPMMWTGRVEVDGPNIELSGSIGEIIGKLSGMNPNYIEEQAAILRATVHEEFEPIPQIECKASGKPVQHGPKLCMMARMLLASTGGYCSAPPGQCSVISCEFNCGLFLCNEEESEARVPCRQLADDILDIEEKCTKTSANGNQWMKGQVKHADTKSLRTVV